jgi:hypothetical protein
VSVVLPFPRQDSVPPADAGIPSFRVVLWDEVHCREPRPAAVAALPYDRAAVSFLPCVSHVRQYGEESAAVDTHETGAFLTAVIRQIYPRHTIKMLARLLDVPTGTAHSLIHKRLSNWRRRELAEKLLQEIYREIHAHVELCMRLEEMTGNRDAGVDAARGRVGAAADVPDREIDPLLAAARWLAERAARK